MRRKINRVNIIEGIIYEWVLQIYKKKTHWERGSCWLYIQHLKSRANELVSAALLTSSTSWLQCVWDVLDIRLRLITTSHEGTSTAHQNDSHISRYTFWLSFILARPCWCNGCKFQVLNGARHLSSNNFSCGVLLHQQVMFSYEWRHQIQKLQVRFLIHSEVIKSVSWFYIQLIKNKVQ